MPDGRVVLLLTAQAALFGLDVWHERRGPTARLAAQAESAMPGHRAARAIDKDGPRWWLWGVVVFYLTLEGAVAWLLPGSSTIVQSTFSSLTDWFVPRVAALETSGAQAALVASAASHEVVPGPMALLLAGIGLFYLAGFWDYWVHRQVSHGRWFWWSHEYHHLPRQVSLCMPGIVGRPFVWLPTALSTAGTAACWWAWCRTSGWPAWQPELLLSVGCWIVLINTCTHSAFLRQFRLLPVLFGYLGLTSPSEHLLHHAAQLKGNYGNFTTIWDRLFGTYLSSQATAPEGQLTESPALGLPYDQDFLGTLCGGRWKLSSRWRQRLEVARYCRLDDGRLSDTDRSAVAEDAKRGASGGLPAGEYAAVAGVESIDLG